jgi:hypothetical protein
MLLHIVQRRLREQHVCCVSIPLHSGSRHHKVYENIVEVTSAPECLSAVARPPQGHP